MGNKKRRNPPRVFTTAQEGPFQIIRLNDGHQLTLPLWRAYMAAIQNNDRDALISARVLTRIPFLSNADGHFMTMESWAAANGYSLLETAESLCSLEDEGLLVWDAEKQIGRRS